MADTPPTPSFWILAWALSATLTAALALWTFVQQRYQHIHLPELDTQVRRLLSAGNRQRAVKLAQALPDAPLLMLLHTALTTRLPNTVSPEAATAGYRDPAQAAPFEQRALAFLQAEARRLAAPFAAHSLLLGLGLGTHVLAAGALVFGETDPAYQGHVLVGVGLLCALAAAILRRRHTQGRDLDEGALRWARFVEPA